MHWRSPHFVFAQRGLGIFWEANRVHLAESECPDNSGPCEPKILQHLSFEGEEVLDVAVHDNNLAILTGILTGGQWRRRLRRREDRHEDLWTTDHPLRSYGVRLFSLQSRLQIGPAMWLPDVGVDASIRAGPNAVIVMITGPTCYASFWRMPHPPDNTWHCFHRELTWDPDVIAKQLGFSNHQEELAHIETTDDDRAPGDATTQKLGWRRYCEDTALMDYVFISDSQAVRLRDTGVDDGSGIFQLEVLDLSGMTTAAVGWTVAPVLSQTIVHHTDIYVGMPRGSISAPTTFSDKDCISVIVICSEGIIETFWTVSSLTTSDPEMDLAEKEVRDGLVHSILKGLGPTFSDMNIVERDVMGTFKGSGPTFFGMQTVFPEVDEPYSLAGVPTVRFFAFPHTLVDVPLAKLLPGDLAPLPGKSNSEYDEVTLSRCAVFWDGGNTVCVTYRDSSITPEVRRQWFVKLGQDILEELHGRL
ncbi:hypothetical protein C8R46DRAFT_1230361 [Mycena filopes]|nr:hypothetical protein C8R46DRAFT_1230361 [Mycena filopes]